MVDLKQPGLTCLVDEDIKTKNFKAHVIVDVAGLTRPIMMIQIWLD